MFEVGKKYEFTTLESSEDGLCEGRDIWTVAAIEGPLLHLRREAVTEGNFVEILGGPIPERNMVLNTGSAFFHSARPHDEPVS